MCNQPAASYCFDADHLRVSDPPGVCDPQDGLCDYPTHDEYCAFGCANGACNNDPCIGVVCPAKVSYCSDANTVVQFDEGQCINGLPCTYASMAVNCPNGCVNGQCIACTVDAQCGSGKWCSGNQCLPCSEDLHCGATCIACGGATPKCNGVACVQCLTNAQCAAGNWCNGSSQCEACNTPQHCGPACAACGGQTPICGPSGCVECLNDVDCGAGEWCSAMTCQTCNTDQHCGASCVACGGATPHCNGASCVECLTAADCNVGEDCGPASTCIPAVGCVPPAAACTTGGTQDGGCANPYRISRNDAGTASGFTVNNTYGLCNRANNFTTGNCGGNTGSDAEYRLFMLKGETANITLTRGASTCTIGWAGTISLKIYEAACNADCTMCPQTCSTIDHCVQNNNQNTNFVAPSDGWYTIVVDSAGPVDDKGGVFYLNVKLTCSGGSCACQ
jgi:Cys-rich repeat protein